MDEALLQSLSSMGLPEGVTDPNAILAWVVGNMAAVSPATPEAIESMEGEMPEEEKPVENMEGEEPKEEVINMEGEEEIKASVDRALKAERKRQREIRAICERAGIERAVADALCESGASLDRARKEVLDQMVERSKPVGQTVEKPQVTASRDEKFFAAVHSGLLQRSFASAGIRQAANIAPGADDFRFAKTSDIAAEICRELGAKTLRMNKGDMLKVALGHGPTMQRYGIRRDGAWHTTGSFQNLLADVSNKTLLAAYEEAPYTWTMWARQAESVADFKPIYRMRLSEVSDLEMIPENHPYPEAALSDKKESYKVEKFGKTTTISWETYVNDDLDALSRVPTQQARAARRTQNKLVYDVLTANANLADGGALFNSTAQSTVGGHANLATSTGAPNTTTLNAAYVSMMTKKGLNADTILSIQPAFIIVPAALSGTVLQLLASLAPPEVGGNAAGNSNVANLYGPNGERPLRPVIEPYLDAASTTAWYVAANSSDVDTIELSFLQGEESPVLENEWDFDHDAYKLKVRQTFGAAAIDFRGLYKNAG